MQNYFPLCLNSNNFKYFSTKIFSFPSILRLPLLHLQLEQLQRGERVLQRVVSVARRLDLLVEKNVRQRLEAAAHVHAARQIEQHCSVHAET